MLIIRIANNPDRSPERELNHMHASTYLIMILLSCVKNEPFLCQYLLYGSLFCLWNIYWLLCRVASIQQLWVYQKRAKLCSASLVTMFSEISPKSVCVCVCVCVRVRARVLVLIMRIWILHGLTSSHVSQLFHSLLIFFVLHPRAALDVSCTHSINTNDQCLIFSRHESSNHDSSQVKSALAPTFPHPPVYTLPWQWSMQFPLSTDLLYMFRRCCGLCHSLFMRYVILLSTVKVLSDKCLKHLYYKFI